MITVLTFAAGFASGFVVAVVLSMFVCSAQQKRWECSQCSVDKSS